jgi:tellurite resistance protein TehA-like permease
LVATAWIPPLIFLTVQRFRRRRGLPQGLWWAAVFPLGMYSSATYATAVETGWGWLTVVSQVFFWIAFAAWTLTALHALSRIGSPQHPLRVGNSSSHVRRRTCQPSSPPLGLNKALAP